MRISMAGFAIILLLGSILLNGFAETSIPPKQLEIFEKKIRPVLVDNRYSCHSAGEKIKGGLRLDTAEAILMGGDTRPAIEPGDSEVSLLVEALK